MDKHTPSPMNQAMPGTWRRLVLPLFLVAVLAAVYFLGLNKSLSLQAIADNRENLRAYTSSHPIQAFALFMLVYATVVALSVPGATIFTVLGGLLFGWLAGGLASMFAATLGAAGVFVVARSSLGDGLVKRAGPFLSRLREGFGRDAFNYLLFLRLVPAFPFWLVNVVSAALGVPLRTFLVATLIGIIPGTFAFAFLGEGFDSVVVSQKAAYEACVANSTAGTCKMDLSLSQLVTWQLLAAFTLLGVISLVPILMRKARKTS